LNNIITYAFHGRIAFSLPPDITGAILIPIGTSGPEIFSSAISVFFTDNDIGTGAIFGSAVFNLLAIPATCGIAVAYFIGEPIQLEKFPILRDSLFYIISIMVLILVIRDNKVDL
jgi:Ca2+/Na+ antiporter